MTAVYLAVFMVVVVAAAVLALWQLRKMLSRIVDALDGITRQLEGMEKTLLDCKQRTLCNVLPFATNRRCVLGLCCDSSCVDRCETLGYRGVGSSRSLANPQNNLQEISLMARLIKPRKRYPQASLTMHETHAEWRLGQMAHTDLSNDSKPGFTRRSKRPKNKRGKA